MITFGWTMDSLAGQEVWKRLAQGDFGPQGLHRSLIVGDLDGDIIKELACCLAPSERSCFLLWLDPSGEICSQLSPETDQACGAWDPKGGLAALGTASETAWEAMAKSLRGKQE